MNRRVVWRYITALLLTITLIVIPDVLVGEIVWVNMGVRTAVILSTLLLVYIAELRPQYSLPSSIAALLLSIAAYIYLQLWDAVWLIVPLWFALILLIGRQLFLVVFQHKLWHWVWRFVVWIGSALIAGMGLILFDTVLSHFAEEEFFVAVSGLALTLFWLLLFVICHLICAVPHTPFSPKIKYPVWSVTVTIVSLVLMALLLIPLFLQQYQLSFFPRTAPTYDGISENSPFICEQMDVQLDTISGEQIKYDLIQLLEVNPDKTTLTWGNLALYSHDADAASQFRTALLQEAEQKMYTTPAHSIKWGQYEAALRAHQYVLLDQAFPDLFSETDRQVMAEWLTAVNHRAMTTEWVDWLYAAAYGKQPQGPYENQEIGAGLLAALMNYGLAADELLTQNEEYLDTVPLGWGQIFRNTDDSYSYQSVWLANAWWIEQYRQQKGESSSMTDQNIELSINWMLLMALPDGESLSYNINGEPTMALPYLVGAVWTQDPAITWLAGHTVQRLRDQDKTAGGNFALDPLLLSDGQKPSVGSCLLFGNSGVPTNKGPLAPDKVVLRDGWYDEAAYILLNLRFTGWHRYKATNTLPLIYQDGPLVSERWTSEKFWWLPSGRGAFRDKRVPREFLNGLLLPKSGLPEAIWRITAVGTPWLQDPPAYAEPDHFFTSKTIDMATTTVENWHGWQHQRTIYLIHDGLILVMDDASSSQPSYPPSLIWHLSGSGEMEEGKVHLNNDQRIASMAWAESDDSLIARESLPPSDAYLRSPDWKLLYTSESDTELKTSAAFLTQKYAQGDIDLTYIGENKDGSLINWSLAGEKVILLHNFTDRYLEGDILGTDGKMVLLMQNETESKICYVDGTIIRVLLPNPEDEMTIKWNGITLDSTLWQWDDQELIISPLDTDNDGCLTLNYE